MDLQALQARARSAREFDHAIGEITYRLRVPTQHEALVAAHRTGVVGQAQGAAYLLLMRAVLEAAVCGWQGLRVGHVVPGGDDAATPLPWSADAVALVLDARPADAQALADAMGAQMVARAAAFEADAKN